MISADEAIRIVLENVATLGVERVSIRDALNRVLAEEIRSPRDIPGFDNSAMDGFAVRSADLAGASERSPAKLRVLETIAAGAMPRHQVTAGSAARIMTGAPVPAGADAIIPVEQTRSDSDTVEILVSVERGHFIRPRGEDIRRDDVVLSSGKRLGPSDLGLVASLNRATIDVRRRSRVAIVSTGDELVDVDEHPTGAQIVNSSAYALAAGVEEAGGEPVMLKIARDREAEIEGRIREALRFDAVLSTGGVSVGQFDHVKVILDRMGMHQLFHGVAQRPGRPLKFGLIDGRPIFGLPGNPVSTMVCFYIYARPAILKMGGRSDVGLPRAKARCATDIRVAPNLTEFVRVKLERRDGELLATPTGTQGSGILSALSKADALLIGPQRESILKAGTQATVLLLRDAVESDAGVEERHLFQ